MKDKRLLIVVSIFLVFSGCSKERLSGTAKISRVYAGGQLQVQYYYDTEGRLKSHVVFGFPGRKTSEQTCYYAGSGRLIKRESAFDFSSGPNPQWSYSYTDYEFAADGKISEEKNYLKQGSVYVLDSKINPIYAANGKLISRKMFLPNDAPIRLTNYEYDNRGNIILQEEYKYNTPVPEIEYSYRYDAYDNKRNPYMGLVSTAPPFSINMNNILKTTVTNYVVTPGTPVTATSNTDYNSYNKSGLPVKVFENGTNFIYEYQ